MASFSGILHRQLSAATAVAVAAVSSDLSDIFTQSKSTDSAFSHQLSDDKISLSSGGLRSSWVSRISFSNLSFSSSSPTQVPALPKSQNPPSNLSTILRPKSLFSLFSYPSPSLPPSLNLHQYTNISPKNHSLKIIPSSPSSTEEVSYRWHLPNPNNHKESDGLDCPSIRSQTVVVLLGWLGAKQKHLKKYADWYTSRGFHVVTFTLPMEDIMSYRVLDKAEKEISMLARHLAGYVDEEDHGKNLIFHTFSNTGWIMYGVILENFHNQDPSLMDKIKCCIVDSAPVASPDPQVWASGFSAAILKKQSSASRLSSEPSTGEIILQEILEGVFKIVLNLPPVNRRLEDVFEVLTWKQPKCPQLYVYSSSDRVIPASSVESFVEEQRQAGREVRAHNFVSSPHVDHFRSHPSVYASHLSSFLNDYVLTCAQKQSPP